MLKIHLRIKGEHLAGLDWVLYNKCEGNRVFLMLSGDGPLGRPRFVKDHVSADDKSRGNARTIRDEEGAEMLMN